MSRNEGRFSAAEGSPTPEDEGTSAVAASAAGSQFNWALPTEFVELKVNTTHRDTLYIIRQR